MTDEEFGLLQSSIDAIMERVAELRLGLAVEYDFQKLTEFLLATRSPLINPTFDPRAYPVPKDSFWLRVVDEYGDTVATHAEALFHTRDFISLIESRELWRVGGVPLPPGVEPPTITRPDVEIAGKVGYGGSMWVAEAHRKRGLSMYLPYLSRALFMRNYETDFHTGIVLNGLGLAAVPRAGYGFTHVEPCLTGWFAPSGRHSVAYLCYMSQAEALEQFRRLPLHPAHPIPLRRPTLVAATG